MYSCSSPSENSPLDIRFFRFCLSVLAGGGIGRETLPTFLGSAGSRFDVVLSQKFFNYLSLVPTSYTVLSSKCRPVDRHVRHVFS